MKTRFTLPAALGLCAALLAAPPVFAEEAAHDAAQACVQQKSVVNRNIKVIFIDHEPSQRIGEVVSQIREIRTQALENDHSVIFYMPNNEAPFISLVNLGDEGDERATADAFGQLCYALNQPSHNKDAYFDRKRFVELFSEFGIIQEDGTIGFNNVRVEFWLTEEFWQLGYNESILAPIYFALNVPKLIEQEFAFDAFLDSQVLSHIDASRPFGLKNLGRINNIGVNEYYF